jgi:Cu-Zn family superoxide dismutase
MLKLKETIATAAATVALVAASAAAGQSPEGATARAELKDVQGRVVGEARLTATPNGVIVSARVSGLPAGAHAIHLHETGRCEAPGFTSAGDHFNPDGRQHGYLDAAGPHAGDLPNLHAPTGEAAIEAFVPDVSLTGEAEPLLDQDGAAVVVHARPDDYRTDPAGDAGDRIACGSIEMVR